MPNFSLRVIGSGNCVAATTPAILPTVSGVPTTIGELKGKTLIAVCRHSSTETISRVESVDETTASALVIPKNNPVGFVINDPASLPYLLGSDTVTVRVTYVLVTGAGSLSEAMDAAMKAALQQIYQSGELDVTGSGVAGEIPAFDGANSVVSSGKVAANLPTAAAVYASGQVLVAAGNDRTTTTTGGPIAANIPTAASAFTAGNFPKAAGNDKTLSDSGVPYTRIGTTFTAGTPGAESANHIDIAFTVSPAAAKAFKQEIFDADMLLIESATAQLSATVGTETSTTGKATQLVASTAGGALTCRITTAATGVHYHVLTPMDFIAPPIVTAVTFA